MIVLVFLKKTTCDLWVVVDAGVVADGVVVDSNTEFDVMVPVDAVLTPLNERV